jgi:hypothetical protein
MQKRFLFLLIPFLWFSGKPAAAQLFDDFSDGDFSSNPAWTGMTDNFSAASGQLRTTTASIGSLHLFTATEQPFYSWEFYFRLAFNPTSGNYAEFWLSSDSSNLSQAQNGYFVKFGGNGTDGIGLYKKSGGSTITLINQDGNTLVNGSSNNFGYIRVTRTEAGVWTISEKITSADFLQFGTAIDNGLTGSKGLGIRVISTSSNLTKHYFDDIRAEGLPPPDTLPPNLQFAGFIPPQSIDLQFSESLDSLFAADVNRYSITPAQTILSATRLTSDRRKIRLALADTLAPGNYNIQVSSSRDAAGNTQVNAQNVLFSYYPKQPIAARQLQVNEIMFDPDPVIGLPPAEFLEIHNHGNSPLQLEGVKLAVGNYAPVLLPSFVLPAGGHLTLCDEQNRPDFQQFGPTLGINLPLLSNSGSNIRLIDFQDNETDRVAYMPDWHDTTSKKDGGWSIEQVNPDLICSSKSNWRSSRAEVGGTPGQPNSVLSLQPDLVAPVLRKSERVGNSSLILEFSEPLNALPLTLGEVEINGGISVTEIIWRSPNAESFQLNFSAPFPVGEVYQLIIRNVKDCAENLLPLLEMPVGIGRSPKRFELLMTEVQADDSPENGLPQAEFVEIFNNSTSLLDLSGIKLSDAGGSASLPSRLLAPGEYLVLCGTTSQAKFSALSGVRAQGITSFPTLNLEGDNLTLSTSDGKQLHRFFFRSSQFSPFSRWEKGWSLEMIDTGNPVGEAGNWAISTAAAGGTPGKENSVKAIKPDLEPPQLRRISIPDSTMIRFDFNEQLDSLSLWELTVEISGHSISGRVISDADFSVLQVKITPPLSLNTEVVVQLTGARDWAGNANNNLITKKIGRPNPPIPGSWMLSEILFDPLTGGSDFVEIRNVSIGYLDVKDIRLANGTDEGDPHAESFLLAPGEFALFTESIPLTLRDYPKGKAERFIEINLPSFNLDSGTVRILDLRGAELEKFAYSEKYHAPVLDEVKGVSLERISPNLPSNSSNSWQSASADAGYGTPGYENSNERNFDMAGGFKADPRVFSPNGDGNRDFTLLSYELPETGLFGNLRIYSATGLLIKDLAQSVNLGAGGFWKWDGRNEDGRPVAAGMYLAVLELNKQGAESKSLRVPLAIADDR